MRGRGLALEMFEEQRRAVMKTLTKGDACRSGCHQHGVYDQAQSTVGNLNRAASTCSEILGRLDGIPSVYLSLLVD